MSEKFKHEELPSSKKLNPETQRTLDAQRLQVRQEMTRSLLQQINEFSDNMSSRFIHNSELIKRNDGIRSLAHTAFLAMEKAQKYDPTVMLGFKKMQNILVERMTAPRALKDVPSIFEFQNSFQKVLNPLSIPRGIATIVQTSLHNTVTFTSDLAAIHYLCGLE